MRHILSRYCGVAPSRLPIAETEFGKPYLEAPFSGISFNLSHTRARAILAVSTQVSIGADLEEHRERLDTKTIADCWLHAGERKDLDGISQGERSVAFFRLWCRKEAVLKGKGTGLRAALHQFRVTVCPDRAEVLWWPGEESSWHLYDLRVGEKHSAALALDRPANSLRYQELG